VVARGGLGPVVPAGIGIGGPAVPAGIGPEAFDLALRSKSRGSPAGGAGPT